MIKQLKHKNSCGYDEVTTKILKTVSPFIVSPLTHIYITECCQLEHFRTDQNTQKLNLYIKKGTKPKLQITGQFHYSLYFLKFLKRFYVRDYTIIYP